MCFCLVIINNSSTVNVTEGKSLTVNCSIGTNDPEWLRQDGGAVETKTRRKNGILLHIENASIADTGEYICKHGKHEHTISIQVLSTSRSKWSMQMQKHSASHFWILLTLYNRGIIDAVMVKDTGNFKTMQQIIFLSPSRHVIFYLYTYIFI